MLETIKTILVDAQEAVLPTGVPRHLDLKPVKGKASVCIGVRRCGKSTYLHQIIQKLLNKGVSPQNILYLNFFDDRLHNLRHDNLSIILDAYYSLFPEKKSREKVYCFFDEIQAVTGWEPFVDRLMRTENCQVYLTGSSAHMLSTEIATQMRGRALSWELFPFSFREFLNAGDVDFSNPLSSKKQLLIRKAFEEYWLTGGFPEVFKLDKNLRIKIHQEYFQAILFRDLVERHDVSHPKAVSDLAYWLVDNTASMYSINKLTGYLKSLGHKVPKATVSDYLKWFENAYFLFSVRLFDASLTRSQANPKKVYCIDHSLVTSVSSGVLVNSGHLLENIVFVALRQEYPNIYYYRTKSGKETDFVVPLAQSQKLVVQVCETLVDPQTRKREIDALTESMDELKCKTGIIITRNEEEQIKSDSGNICAIPIWRFLINPQGG